MLIPKETIYIKDLLRNRAVPRMRTYATSASKSLARHGQGGPDPWKTLALPPVRQIGIVVESLPKAVEFYSNAFGIGPWFRSRFAGEEHYLKGKRQIHFNLDIAMAFAGNIQYELIEHKGGDRSIYVDHLEKYGEGLHHLGFFVNDFDQRLASCRHCGITVLQSGLLRSGGNLGGSTTKYAYLDTRQTGGVILEFIETSTMGMKIKASRAWYELGALMGDLEKMDIGTLAKESMKMETLGDFYRFGFRRWSGLS